MNRYYMGGLCYKPSRYVNDYDIINNSRSKNKFRRNSQNNYNILMNNQKQNINSLPKIIDNNNKWQKNNNIKTSFPGIKNKNPQNNNKNKKFYLKQNDGLIKETEDLEQIKKRNKEYLNANNYIYQNDKKAINFDNGNSYIKFEKNNISYKENPQTTNNICYNNKIIIDNKKKDQENQKSTLKIMNRGKSVGKNILKPEESNQTHYSRKKEASVDKNLQKYLLKDIKKDLNIENNKEKYSNEIEPKGLVNLGLNCYMNSLLQCLYYIKDLRREFIMKKNKYREDQKICKAFAEVMYRLKYENANYTDAKEFKKIMGDKNNLFKGCKAADVKDLFINLIDAFMNELSKDDNNESIYNEPNYTDKIEMFQEAEREVDENIIINKLFLGYYESDYQCPVKESIHIYSFQEQTFLLFELLLISKYYDTKYLTLKKCFEYYFSREDKISTFYCSKCNKTHKNKCIEKIYRLPEILIIALDRGFGKAFQGKVEFKTELNLNEDLNNCIDRDNKENRKNIFYKLICISTHSGSSSACGHYTACCLTDNGSYYYFSDTYVHEIKEKRLYDDEPYLLFYQKN